MMGLSIFGPFICQPPTVGDNDNLAVHLSAANGGRQYFHNQYIASQEKSQDSALPHN
jgi:hypothetical protein